MRFCVYVHIGNANETLLDVEKSNYGENLHYNKIQYCQP